MLIGIGIKRLVTDNAVVWINQEQGQQEIMPLPDLVTQALGALQGGIACLRPFPCIHLIPAAYKPALDKLLPVLQVFESSACSTSVVHFRHCKKRQH